MHQFNLIKIPVISILLLWLQGCKSDNSFYLTIKGNSLGNEYVITVKATDSMNIKHAVDSILTTIESSVSLNNPESTLIRYNNSDTTFCFDSKSDNVFRKVFDRSKSLYTSTNGAFNPAVEPLLQYYGFSDTDIHPLRHEDSTVIQKLLQLVVFDSIVLTESDNKGIICISKPDKACKLTFNAIFPGFTVDCLAAYFESIGIKDFMVKLGSEYRSMGNDATNHAWGTDILRPEPNTSGSESVLPLQLSNKAMATNGNYQKIYEVKGQKYSHIISPFTGASHPTDILSVTVISDDCSSADAYATAFMVLGLDKSLQLIDSLKDVEACFIYDNEGDGIFEYKISKGFSKYYLNNEQK